MHNGPSVIATKDAPNYKTGERKAKEKTSLKQCSREPNTSLEKAKLHHAMIYPLQNEVLEPQKQRESTHLEKAVS